MLLLKTSFVSMGHQKVEKTGELVEPPQSMLSHHQLEQQKQLV
jgi:hypothetical protein